MSDRIEQQLRTTLLERADSVTSLHGDPVPAIERRMRQRVRRQVAVAMAAAVAVAATVAGALAASDQIGNDSDVRPIDPPTSDVQPGSWENRAFLFDLDTGQVTFLPLPQDGSIDHVVSPDGTAVAYSDWPDSGEHLAGLYVSRLGPDPADGAVSTRRVTPPSVGAFGPQWSPDGTKLAYQQVHLLPSGPNRVTTGELVVVDIASGQTTRLTHASDDMFLEQDWFISPSFSPDGQTVLFHQHRAGHLAGLDLWSVPATGGEPSLVRRGAAYGAYSPDGSTIAYTGSPQKLSHDMGVHPIPGPGAGESPANGIWLADPDGSNPRPLVEGGKIRAPMWSPDGTRIAYVDGDATSVVDVDTGETQQVASGVAESWFDDDTLIMTATSPDDLRLP
jgi:Tol biopolymer transport system component